MQWAQCLTQGTQGCAKANCKQSDCKDCKVSAAKPENIYIFAAANSMQSPQKLDLKVPEVNSKLRTDLRHLA